MPICVLGPARARDAARSECEVRPISVFSGTCVRYLFAVLGNIPCTERAHAENLNPGKLKAQTAEFIPSIGWNTQNVTAPISLSAGNYWLMWQTDNNGLGVAYTPNGNAGIYKGYAYGPPPSNFPSAGSASPDESIYATLLVAGGSGSGGAGGGNAAPTIALLAAASPNPVPGLTTALSVLGADDGGEASLTYTWTTTGLVRDRWRHDCRHRSLHRGQHRGHLLHRHRRERRDLWTRQRGGDSVDAVHGRDDDRVGPAVL